MFTLELLTFFVTVDIPFPDGYKTTMVKKANNHKADDGDFVLKRKNVRKVYFVGAAADREFKACCARLGIKLTDAITEAIQDWVRKQPLK